MRKPPQRKRPFPVAGLERFAPAPEVRAWVHAEILEDTGAIHNPEHKHLIGADVEFMWAPAGFVRQMRTVIGTTEQVTFRAGGWQKERQEEQMRGWFGSIPKFLITLDASYCATCTDAEFCALVEHELYHVGHLRDMFGQPAFDRDGNPKLGIRGHDVEEFVGVVRRYGVGDPDGAIAKLAAAARGTPEVDRISIAGACGTCLLRAA